MLLDWKTPNARSSYFLRGVFGCFFFVFGFSLKKLSPSCYMASGLTRKIISFSPTRFASNKKPQGIRACFRPS